MENELFTRLVTDVAAIVATISTIWAMWVRPIRAETKAFRKEIYGRIEEIEKRNYASDALKDVQLKTLQSIETHMKKIEENQHNTIKMLHELDVRMTKLEVKE